MGPRARTGRKFRAPTSKTVPSNKIMKVPPEAGNVPTLGGAIFFTASEPASPMIGTIMANRPINIANPRVVLYQGVFAVSPANALPLFAVAEVKA